MQKPNQIEPVLLTADIMEIFRWSESTVKRELEASLRGESDFPLNQSKPGRRRYWLKSEIEAYLSRNSNEQPTIPKFESSTQRSKRNADALRLLKEQHGIEIKETK